jgi:hypothetical protein
MMQPFTLTNMARDDLKEIGLNTKNVGGETSAISI